MSNPLNNSKPSKTVAGFVLDTTPQSILVKQGEAQALTFFNSPEGGLEIIKVSAADKTKRLSGVTFEIRRMDDALVDTVTTGDNGRVHVNLDAGDYYALEIEGVKGFKVDTTPHDFTIKDGENTTLTVANTPYSGIEIHKIDANTGKGIYGAKFLLYDAEKHPVGEYVTDQNGYIYIDDLTRDGKYFIRELECEGYNVDTQIKTVMVKAGEVIQIEWKNTPITGQTQVYKYAAEYNPVTFTAAGSPLAGAVFEIVEVRSGKVVDYITTDARGVAASKPLPLRRYQVKEVTAPAYWQIDPSVHDVTLEYLDVENRELLCILEVICEHFPDCVREVATKIEFENFSKHIMSTIKDGRTKRGDIIRLRKIIDILSQHTSEDIASKMIELKKLRKNRENL